ncbi:MAG TPA: hypothetical protein VFO31_11190 [Vicinamibacterales bacterium]|nr:hypothetical protein [Vicinamibacterales bacterium]
MLTRTLASLALLVTLATAATGPSLAQTATTKPRPVPRTADGKPDLSGIWIAGGIALLFGEDEARRIAAADKAAGRPAPPPREPPPYKPDAEKKRQEYLARRGIDDPMARCLLTGVPRITVRPLPFEIVQLANRVIILYEIHHAFRIIPTDGRPHPDDIEPSYLGDSVAKWEGDTLVVDVTGFNDKTWLAGVGTIHSEKLRVTERYRRDTYETIIYDVTMEDPEVFTRPWHQQETFRLRPDERLREYECIENNEDIVRWEKLLETEFKK